jgi:phage baseplate assembly protein W
MEKGVGFYNKDWFSIKKGKDLLYESVIRILMTAPGERVMSPNFGAGINRQLFELVTPDLLQDLATMIHIKLDQYESRLFLIKEVQTEFVENENIIKIHIFFARYEDPDNVEKATFNYNVAE